MRKGLWNDEELKAKSDYVQCIEGKHWEHIDKAQASGEKHHH